MTYPTYCCLLRFLADISKDISLDPNTYNYFDPAFQHVEGANRADPHNFRDRYTTDVLSDFA